MLNGKKISMVKTDAAHNSLTQGMTPLPAIDVWEYAYSLDYQNRRKDYVVGVVEKLINWNFAAGSLA